jgi:methylenetetrahydrofolate--tRNA-(uracil-5-)-methyltransferase
MNRRKLEPDLIVVGGGLAGSEAAWQAANQGLRVQLYEMRPGVSTGAHTGAYLAELVCSNSLGSNLPDHALGLLKEEMRLLGSRLIQIAQETSVPAGSALAVDREMFARRVTTELEIHPNVEIIREEVTEIPGKPAIIATGPLTSPRFSAQIKALAGQEHLYFYDAIAPIVTLDSINLDKAYLASRYNTGEQEAGDYINCPMDRQEYEAFVDALSSAQRIELRDFEKELEKGVKAGDQHFFEGCLPVEIIARRGRQALAYGPMRPVGLKDPRSGQRACAVVQLRQDNQAGSLYNMVGFQTNLTFSEQRRVLRMIPGLENAEFVRYGQMHRNTFIYSPAILWPTLQVKEVKDLFFAGQITGVEGYLGNIATGLLAGLNAARLLQGRPLLELPATTMLGALCHYITHASPADFQPMKANLGILTPLEEVEPRGRGNRRARAGAYVKRALADLKTYIGEKMDQESDMT